MKTTWFPIVIVAFVLGGCAGLQQFPEVSENYTVELKADAPDYAAALTKIYKLGSSAANTEKKTQIRNEFIETRMAVIDTNFQEFEIALSQENVKVDFVVSVAEVAVGGAGALVSETASQILSAVSAGLAGGQAAYSKAALYDQALSALHAQMIASRKAVLVRITERKKLSYDDYWLSDAKNDLHAYLFAGSLPGAIVGTSADAKVKDDQAEEELLKILGDQTFGPGDNSAKIERYLGWDGSQFSNAGNVQNLNAWKQLKGIAVVTNTSFLNAEEWKSLRAKAVQELNIP